MFDILPWKRNKKTHANESHRQFGTMSDRFFDPDFMPSASVFGIGKWGPKLDVSERRKDIIVKAEIAGIEAKDLDISIDGRLLNIRGEKQQEQTDEEEIYYRVESSYGYFNRTIELPAEVDPNKVDASYKKGILKIKLRKTKSSETKRIKVRAGSVSFPPGLTMDHAVMIPLDRFGIRNVHVTVLFRPTGSNLF